ncbi:MAG: hotdog fold thioesterase [Chitinophagales bacterium]|nr:hotdog fold thioesterase [Chitinophagales bacterium]
MNVDASSIARQVVDKMLEQDTYGKWLNPIIEKIAAGYCLMKMPVRPEFLNGVGTVHGGIVFGIADTAFAYASNSHNRIAVALDVTISYPNAGQVDDVFTIEAKEIYLGGRTAIYQVTVINQQQLLIGLFQGTVFRTHKKYFEEAI